MSVAMVEEGNWEEVWNEYMEWVAEEKKKRLEEELVQKGLPVKSELLKQKVRNW